MKKNKIILLPLIIILLLFSKSTSPSAQANSSFKKGINIITETNAPDSSVPSEITETDINYLKDLGVNFVQISPGWYRLACKDPHSTTKRVTTSQTPIYASSELNSSFQRQNLLDGNPTTAWSSRQYTSSQVLEWISIDLGQSKIVSEIVLIPRVAEGQIQALPVDFNFSYSDDGQNWFILPNQSYTNYPKPGLNPDGTAPDLKFTISPPATHRYFGFGVTRASTDSYGGYFAQLAEFKLKEPAGNFAPDDPNNPNYNWAFLDRSIDRLWQAGIREIGIQLGGSPRWAVENVEDSCWSEPNYPDFLNYSALPSSRYRGSQEYGYFMKAVAQRYKGKVKYYSLWNEPNFNLFWKGSIEQFVQMSNSAYDQMKSVDPEVEIWAGNTAPNAYGPNDVRPIEWLRQAKSLGLKFDAYAHHFYPLDNQKPPWNQPNIEGAVTLNNVDKLLAEVGDKPIVNNESGYYTRGDHPTTEENQAEWLKWSMEEFSKYPQIKLWANFMLYNHPNWGTGFIRKDQGDRKLPAYWSFKNFTPLSPTPSPTPPPSFSLSPGWNQITWPDVSGKKASDTPPECPIAVAKENFWFKPYVKNFGGMNFNFEKDKVYYLKCNQETVWQL